MVPAEPSDYSAEERAADAAAELPPHWHVANGTPGYLFDSDPPLPTFDRVGEAIAYAWDEAREERDQRNETASQMRDTSSGAERWVRVPLPREERWTISARPSVRDAERYGAFAVSIDRAHDPYSLPYQWEGWRCADLDCDPDAIDSRLADALMDETDGSAE
jgi:hypothetical protein